MRVDSYRMDPKDKDKEELGDLDEQKENAENYWQVIRNYGVTIFDLCEVVPDGIVVYFPTRDLMKDIRAEWEAKENIYERINSQKRVF